jgi:pimeloyl-ACP methyl ester carboxylesterase
VPTGRALIKAGAAAIGLAAAGIAVRYHRDLVDARARLAQVDRRTVETRLGPVEFCEWGEGPPVLLVHGVVGGCDVPPSWRALVPDGYRIIAPSRFGYLGAAMPPRPSVAAQADLFGALLDALGIEQTLVLGFSAGSTSSVQLALRHPERVAALVLAAANAPHEKPITLVPRALAPLVFSQPMLWFLRIFLPEQLAQIAGTPAGYPLSEDDHRTLATIFDSFFPMGLRTMGCIFDGYVGNPDIANYPLEQIAVPTLGVHAADDPLAPYEDARAMVARIPDSRWVRVERGGHIFLHKDELAKREIAAFLSANAPSRSSDALDAREHGLRLEAARHT